MPPPYIASPSQRRSPFQITNRILEITNAHKSHAGQSSSRPINLSTNGWGQYNGLDKPLESWQVGITVLVCLIGVAILSWILYYCWKYGAPRPTYLETAMRIQKKNKIYQCKEIRHHPPRPPRRVVSTRWVDPVVVAVDEELARPDAARIRSSSCYDE
ncbi:hypothetical protein F5Y12DRAFT_688356 [Xylaria sp. FL1777]|nr:hypothetical protein F5Y12DRAFT_688356 [Xylaria sp. FL1777]